MEIRKKNAMQERTVHAIIRAMDCSLSVWGLQHGFRAAESVLQILKMCKNLNIFLFFSGRFGVYFMPDSECLIVHG